MAQMEKREPTQAECAAKGCDNAAEVGAYCQWHNDHPSEIPGVAVVRLEDLGRDGGPEWLDDAVR